MMRHSRILLAVLAAVLAGGVCLGARAQTVQAGDIRIENPWARATPGQSRVGAAYFTIREVGRHPDRLLGVSSPLAGRGELHTHRSEGGVMQMRQVQAVDIPSGGSVELQPGGFHVMLMDLKQPLREGEPFVLTLEFERAGRVEVTVPVTRPGARSPADAPSGHSMPGQRHHGG